MDPIATLGAPLPTDSSGSPAKTRRGRKSAAVAAEEAAAAGVVSLAPLTETISQYLTPEEVRHVRDAYRFSDEAHLGQFRVSGEPYISHPIAVAQIVAEWKLDAAALMAALL